jgi:hypothetical protein
MGCTSGERPLTLSTNAPSLGSAAVAIDTAAMTEATATAATILAIGLLPIKREARVKPHLSRRFVMAITKKRFVAGIYRGCGEPRKAGFARTCQLRLGPFPLASFFLAASLAGVCVTTKTSRERWGIVYGSRCRINRNAQSVPRPSVLEISRQI